MTVTRIVARISSRACEMAIQEDSMVGYVAVSYFNNKGWVDGPDLGWPSVDVQCLLKRFH